MRTGAVVLAFALGAGSAFGEPTGAAFLKIPPSVRAQSLGGNQALLMGPEALGANPAGLALQPTPWGGYAAYSSLESEMTHGQFAVVRRHSKSRRAWGLALTSLKADGGAATDATGAPAAQTTGAQDIALTMGLGGPLKKNWFWGAAGRGIRSTVGNVSSDIAWAVDLGVLRRGHTFSGGVSLNNFGTDLSYGNQADPLPSSLRLDGAWDLGALTIVGQGHAGLKEDRTQWGAGLEYEVGPLTLRGAATAMKSGGVSGSGLDGSDLLERFSFGLGFRAGPSQWDYAFSELEGGQGTWHRLAVVWRWGEVKGNKGGWNTRVEGDLFGTPVPAQPARAPSGRRTLGTGKKSKSKTTPAPTAPPSAPKTKATEPTSTAPAPNTPSVVETPGTEKPPRRFKLGD